MSGQSSNDPIPRLLRVAEACQTLGLQKSKVYELMNEGRLKSVRIGAARRIPEPMLREFVQSLTGGTFPAA